MKEISVVFNVFFIIKFSISGFNITHMNFFFQTFYVSWNCTW